MALGGWAERLASMPATATIRLPSARGARKGTKLTIPLPFRSPPSPIVPSSLGSDGAAVCTTLVELEVEVGTE
eukprot:scaffold74050_cov37-Tisochrysis_lutea.AAC.6